MIDGTYKKVIFYDLPALWFAQGGDRPITIDVSNYRWIKAFAVKVGTDIDGGVATPVISASYYASNGSTVTLTEQIADGNPITVQRSSKSIFGNGTSSGFSTLVIPNNSTFGHTLCKAANDQASWHWYPYRLKSLTFAAPNEANPSNSGLLLLF